MENWNKNLLMKAAILFMVGAALVKFFPNTEEFGKPNPDYLSKSTTAFSYAKANKMDTTVCFLINMRIHSGRKRFAVWDFKGDSVMQEMVVAHGSAGVKGLPESKADRPTFSNIPGSYASSLGRYRVGKRSYSNWGINVHYKLHGLDSTNSNVFRRIVVLHSYIGINQAEVYPEEPTTSLGCPMVSNEDMLELDKLLKTKKDVLMWIYF